jgi:tetratricopeptide (TPR) repeat protein
MQKGKNSNAFADLLGPMPLSSQSSNQGKPLATLPGPAAGQSSQNNHSTWPLSGQGGNSYGGTGLGTVSGNGTPNGNISPPRAPYSQPMGLQPFQSADRKQSTHVVNTLSNARPSNIPTLLQSMAVRNNAEPLNTLDPLLFGMNSAAPVSKPLSSGQTTITNLQPPINPNQNNLNLSFFDNPNNLPSSKPSNQSWEQLDPFSSSGSGSVAKSNNNDVFDVDFLGKANPKIRDNNNSSENFDDLLGALSLPVESIPKQLSVVKTSASKPEYQTPTQTSRNDNKVDTRLDEGMAQLLAMGFDTDASMAALIANDYNVQDAIGNLISGNSTSRKNRPKKPATPESLSPDDELLQAGIADLMKLGFDPREAKAALVECNMDHQAATDLLVNSGKSSKFSVHPKVQQLMLMGFRESACQAAIRSTNGDVEKAVDLLVKQKQVRSVSFSSDHSSSAKLDAAKLADAASQFGVSVFKNAKNVFNLSKEKVGKVLSELTSEPSRRGGPSQEEWSKSNFKDSLKSEREVEQIKSTSKPYSPTLDGNSTSTESLEVPLKRNIPTKSSLISASPISKEGSVADLLSLGDTTVAKPHEKLFVPVTPVNLSKPDIPHASSMVKPQVFASNDLILKSNELKRIGNEFFKQGQFGDAEERYSLAIQSLPAGHSLLLPLYNNRAACRLKNGNNKGAVADCDHILESDPSDLKALLRRATGYEALEIWEKGREDYRKIMSIDPNAKAVSLGFSRCQNALQPKTYTAIVSTSGPKPVAVSVKKAVDEAIQKLRDSNVANEQIENEKYAASEAVSIKVF